MLKQLFDTNEDGTIYGPAGGDLLPVPHLLRGSDRPPVLVLQGQQMEQILHHQDPPRRQPLSQGRPHPLEHGERRADPRLLVGA